MSKHVFTFALLFAFLGQGGWASAGSLGGIVRRAP
jgi:hypothetical protein